jgi:hypothetical protein
MARAGTAATRAARSGSVRPLAEEVIRIAPDAGGDAGQAGGAERGRLDHRGRRTGTPITSAWNCISQSFSDAPPSTASSAA